MKRIMACFVQYLVVYYHLRYKQSLCVNGLAENIE